MRSSGIQSEGLHSSYLDGLDETERSSSSRRKRPFASNDLAEVPSDEEEDAKWDPIRQKLNKILRSTAADIVLGAVIAVSLVVVIAETDATIDGEEPPLLIQQINIAFTVLYSVELMLRIYVERRNFFSQWFNLMDFFIVFVDVVLKVLGTSSIVSTLRIFRLAKLARVLVLLVKFPELHMILRGLYCTIKSIFWGMCLLVTIVVLWSILAVQLIHPINKDIDYDECERCNRAFEGVFNSFLTIFQTVVAGDSWGLLAIPIIEHNPICLVYFFAVFVTISLLVLNLILATTVERASEAQNEDEAELCRRMMEEKKKAYKIAEKRLKVLCKEMDKDRSGALTLEELQNGYRCNQEFQNFMKAMDIREEDMRTVFRLLDTDNSGDVNYEEFVESLHMMKTRDSHTLLMFTYHHVEDIVAKSAKQLQLLTSKRDGMIDRISDEVTAKTLRALGPILEATTRSTQPSDMCQQHEDEEGAPFPWSSVGLPPMEPTPPQAQVPPKQKLEHAKALAPAVEVPPVPPATPQAGALSSKGGMESKKWTAQIAAFPRCRSSAMEANADVALVVEDRFTTAKDVGKRRERRPVSEQPDRSGLGASEQGDALFADLGVLASEQLAQITAAVQQIEWAIGGAGQHSLWFQRCPPSGQEGHGVQLQEGMVDTTI